MAVVRRTWFADAGQLASIRSEVRRWLESLGVIEDGASDVVFAVSEAASNAVEHAYRQPAADDVVELRFWTEGAALCIEVVDHGRWRPPASSELSGRGRGIPMMREHSSTVIPRILTAPRAGDRGGRVDGCGAIMKMRRYQPRS